MNAHSNHSDLTVPVLPPMALVKFVAPEGYQSSESLAGAGGRGPSYSTHTHMAVAAGDVGSSQDGS